MSRRAALFVGLALLVTPRLVQAAPLLITLSGTADSTLGAEVLLEYDPLLAVLTLGITNTSEQGDPRITSFSFNAPAEVTGVKAFSSTIAGWNYVFHPDGIDTPGQYGYFDVAGISGNNFNGGNANEGVIRDSTATFMFGLTGANLSSLTELSFVNALSFDPVGKPNEKTQTFAVRFQRTGADGEGSDIGIPTSVVPVPEPVSLSLIGLGLAGLAAGRHIRRRK